MSKWLLVVYAVGMTAFGVVQTWRLMSVSITPSVSKAKPVPPGAIPVAGPLNYMDNKMHEDREAAAR
jgi:hypothetical protein